MNPCMLLKTFAFVFRLSETFSSATRMPFYAVRVGRAPGIYNDWDSCKEQVNGFPKARYKKFGTQQEALDFVNGSNSGFTSDQFQSTSKSYTESNNYKSHKKTNKFSSSFPNTGANSKHTVNPTITSLKQQVNHLSNIVHQLSDQINNCEENHSKPGYKRPHGLSRSYSTQASGGQSQRSVKRFKQDNSSTELNDGVVVYTDGACFGNGKNGACAGIGVYWGENHPDNVSERLPGRQTNNRAEIHAAVKAIKQAKSKGINNLVLNTDSQFLINGITKWIHGWKRNGWKLSTGQPVVNRDDFEELDSNLRGINIQWVHVRGHRGIEGNEAADRLANMGAVKPPIK